MTFGLGVLSIFMALSATGSGGPAKDKASEAAKSGNTAVVRDRLPSKVELKEAMGLASDILEQQRKKLEEERRRLDELKGEIKSEFKRLGRLQKGMKNGRNSPDMPTVGTSLDGSNDEMNRRAMEKLTKEQAKQRRARVRHVAKSLAAMSPKAAAVAISRMNDRLAVELLSVVDGKKVGKIFEVMNAERAAVLMQKVIEIRAVTPPIAAKKKGSS